MIPSLLAWLPAIINSMSSSRKQTRRVFARRITSWLSLLVFALQSACTATGEKVPETVYQEGLGRVAIVSADREAEIIFEGFAHGKGEGAVRGTGSTLAACLEGLGHGSCSGDICGAVVLFGLVFCGVAGAVGGAAGAAAAPSAGKVQQSEQLLSDVMQPATIQDSLSRHVAGLALAWGENLVSPATDKTELARRKQDYTLLADQGVDTVMEVALTRAGTRGRGIDAPVQLYMETQVRLVRTADNSELFSTDYEYQGRRLKLADWTANQGKALLRGLEDGYETLGSHIYESVFLLFPFPDRGAHSAGPLAAAFGLAPISPETRGQLSGDVLFGDMFEWVTVDGLHPALSWQAFPRESDLARTPELAGRISKVRYDLLIAREHNLAPAGIVYRRDGLPGTTHAVQGGLQPGARYFWTVRARFELDGRDRVTEWASTHYQALNRMTSPSPFSYRFKTR